MPKGQARTIDERIDNIDKDLEKEKQRHQQKTKELKSKKDKLLIEKNKVAFDMVAKADLTEEELKEAIEYAKSKKH